MKLIVLCALVAVALSLPVEETENDLKEWENFKVKYERNYEVEEEVERKALFMRNLKFIREHNAKFARGETSFTVAVNKFADLTKEEMVARWKGFKAPSESEFHGEEFVPSANSKINSTVDWRKLGAVTPVKDQGGCGSCWAFSTTGTIEGQHFLSTSSPQLVSLSEQDLVDCSKQNSGCGGGYPFLAMEDVIKAKGIDTEKSYAYTGEDGKCRYKTKNVGATISSYKNITSGSEKMLHQAVATVGPISVAIDASSDAFSFYSSGVYDDKDCSNKFDMLDHAVLAVGYGTSGGKAYWLVKNSWGTGWGMDGYIMMSRNKKNQCGIATCASYPVV